LAVNDLIRKTVRGVKVVMALSNLSVGRSFVNETQDVVIVEDVIRTVAAPVCSFNVSLMSSDLN
jgi:hypothetical protein